jgi:hypothetical protein
MSLRSMAVMRAEAERVQSQSSDAERGVRRGGRRSAGAAAPQQPKELAKPLDQLIALIPSEAVALFILLIGLTAEEALGWRAAMLGLVALFALGWTVLSYWEAKGGRRGAGWPAFEMGVGVVAFLAWSTSVPASPFTDLDLPTWVGGAIVAITSAVLVFVSRTRAVWTKEADAPAKPAEPAPAG